MAENNATLNGLKYCLGVSPHHISIYFTSAIYVKKTPWSITVDHVKFTHIITSIAAAAATVVRSLVQQINMASGTRT